MPRTPELDRFLDRHSVSIREEVEADVAPWRGMSPAERWHHFQSLAGTLAWIRRRPDDHVRRVLEWRDPPHESYRLLIASHRQNRDDGDRWQP